MEKTGLEEKVIREIGDLAKRCGLERCVLYEKV